VAVGPGLGIWATALLHLLIAVGMLVVVPLGLPLVERPLWTRVRRLWWPGAVAGAVSLWLPRGWPAAVLALGYAAATVPLFASAVRRLWSPRLPAPATLAVATALAAPIVAGTSLVAERGGYPLLGFSPTVLALTEAHFHYAGFAAALIACLVVRLLPQNRWSVVAALSVPGGVGLVFAGYFAGAVLQLAGAVLLTVGMWSAGWLTWRQIRATTSDTPTRVLLGVAATVLAGTMVLAVDWALGKATGVPHLPLAWMVATHGLANALGFALCALLAWRRLAGERAAVGPPTNVPSTGPSHPVQPRLRELETPGALGPNAAARLFIDFEKHSDRPGRPGGRGGRDPGRT
jgi:hypothetical protein